MVSKLYSINILDKWSIARTNYFLEKNSSVIDTVQLIAVLYTINTTMHGSTRTSASVLRKEQYLIKS